MQDSNDIKYYKKKIGTNIAKYRKLQNLSQKNLAEIIGIAPQTLSCIESACGRGSGFFGCPA